MQHAVHNCSRSRTDRGRPREAPLVTTECRHGRHFVLRQQTRYAHKHLEMFDTQGTLSLQRLASPLLVLLAVCFVSSAPVKRHARDSGYPVPERSSPNLGCLSSGEHGTLVGIVTEMNCRRAFLETAPGI